MSDTRKRLLIVSCSATKRTNEEPLPAIERYDGPMWRVVRAFRRNNPLFAQGLDVWAFSAKHGLIPDSRLICNYDQLMTPARAVEIRSETLKQLSKLFDKPYSQVCLALGQTYLLAIEGWKTLQKPEVDVTVTDGTAGVKLAQLRAWLDGETWQPSQVTQPTLQASETPRGRAIVAGTVLEYTREEVVEKARQALEIDSTGSQAFRDWYVLIDDRQISPKWLVSMLSGKSTSMFQAAAARQALLALGIDVHRVQKSLSLSE